ncbi:hypothetical protein PPL_10907 [Heterostelium album PN500]|uniref:Ankyrin repeat protein n=1 Tax=Heterostelium pallidum (strain ATCC 26659 / Pp 5 / PN500) TaxID=670386 RepID=D3BSE0_HETP5|nr:hypothetical protein PPL_10907 [Heterostelium album PN500]EFA75646.1 hypothetical protein PPL_10907 [Heterostelium album PN500]|eukprot:XP_020427780.1 hypothetical protein PPL_10907 [Heterostelium album PN500]
MISFKRLLHSVVLRNKIFESVRDIHDQLATDNSLRCDWYDLGCFPDQLIKFNYIERYKKIFNTLIRDKINYNSFATITKFRLLYLDSLRNAFDVGNLEVVEFIHLLSKDIEYSDYLKKEHYMNNLELIQFLDYNVDQLFKHQGSRILDNVALGSFHVFKWLYENRSERSTYDSLYNAARNGNLDILKYLLEENQMGETKNLLLPAAVNGHLETLEYLDKSENLTGQLPDSIIIQVVRGGHLPTVKYIIENTKQYLPNNLIVTAANNGHFDLVKYFLENTTALFNSDTIDAVAGHGDLEFIKQLHNNPRSKFTSTAMHMAAVNGHIEVVRFLHENRTEGCRYDTMTEVAMNAHFETFKYLFENQKDLHITDSLMDYFAKYKDSSALQWLKDNTTLQCSDFAYRYAIRQANLPIIKWIHDNTSLLFPQNAMYLATSCLNNDLRIVQYLHDNGVICTTNAMDNCHKLSILEYLHFNQSKRCSSEAMEKAIENENVPIIKFLLQNSTEHLLMDYSKHDIQRSKTLDYSSRIELIKKHNL